MSRAKAGRRQSNRPTNLAKARVEYNLEKQPLHNDSHIAFGSSDAPLDAWTRRRQAVGWLSVVLMVLVIGIGATVAWYLMRAFDNPPEWRDVPAAAEQTVRMPD